MADFESQSWKERCDRYFSSISDTGKDRDQEKTTKNDSENSRDKRTVKNEFFDDVNEKGWKDLSEIKRDYSEHSIVRSIRNILSILDVHGSNLASKTNGRVGLLIWMIIILVSIITLSILFYFMLTDYLNMNSTFRITSTEHSKRSALSDISLTVCNLNLIRKSRLGDTGLKDLNLFIAGETNLGASTAKSSVNEVTENNVKLKEFITKQNGPGKISELIETIEKDVIARELVTASDSSLLYRLGKFGRPQILREVINLSETDLEKGGHEANETLVQCWKDYTKCHSSDIHTRRDPDNGNCVVLTGLGNSTTVELMLNAQTDEYIHDITPMVGFKVSLGEGSDMLSSSQMEISPGFRSTISIDKVTSVKRLGEHCTVTGDSKTICESNCLKDHVLKLCDCSMNGNTSDANMCIMKRVSDYVCVSSLKILQIQSDLPCQCKEKCSEKKLDLKMSAMRWSHKQYMDIYGDAFRTLLPGQQNLNESYLRDNIAILKIDLLPRITEELEESKANEILDLIAKVGGLSAVIAGVSLITILEILYVAVQSLSRSFLYVRKRSGSVASQRRLSDSEITSITWAMYRQRRRQEEVNKMKADKSAANNIGTNAMGGNVHARISKRSSYDRDPKNDQVIANNHKQYRSNEYPRRYDVKTPLYQQRPRENYVKDSDLPKENNGEEYTVNVIRPHRQSDYIYDNRHEPIHTTNVLHKSGTKYKETNAVDQYHPHNVFLYDGAVAYFNPANVSEPVYL